MKSPTSTPTVLLTGAGGGMGQAISARLCAEGWAVIGLDRRFPAGVTEENITDPCPAPLAGGSIRCLPCDVTDAAAVNRAAGWVERSGAALSALVHTAGIYDLDSLIEMDEERFLRMFQVNLFGVYRVNRAFLPFLTPGSRVVITSSELAPLDPLPFTGVYAVTKGALEKYAYSLRMELNLLGIRVSVIRPGAVNTGLLGDSTTALDRFCDHTTLYTCNAARFRAIVNQVEARNVPPARIAAAVDRALTAKKPRFLYNINRNPLLRLLNLMPEHFQVWVIGQVLKPPRKP